VILRNPIVQLKLIEQTRLAAAPSSPPPPRSSSESAESLFGDVSSLFRQHLSAQPVPRHRHRTDQANALAFDVCSPAPRTKAGARRFLGIRTDFALWATENFLWPPIASGPIVSAWMTSNVRVCEGNDDGKAYSNPDRRGQRRRR
jgi:hypothetical protein